MIFPSHFIQLLLVYKNNCTQCDPILLRQLNQSSPITKPQALRDNPGLQADEIREQLAKNIASAMFRGSLRLTSFLRFIVEAARAGLGGRIKEYTVAVEALGRPADSTHRPMRSSAVEAGRLRRALANYYIGAGIGDPILIEMRRGCYVPIFSEHERLTA